MQRLSGQRTILPLIPAASFGIVLGLAGLSVNWHMASELWAAPKVVAVALNWLAVAVWFALTILFAAKWLVAREQALFEANHPIQGCSIGLAGVATMLVARGLLPYSRSLAVVLFGLGGLFSIIFAVWRTGSLWQGGRDIATTTPVLYLPTVAGSLVCALVLVNFGYPQWAQLAFGAGIFSWLALESVLLQRLLTGPELPTPLRPTMGIVFAPPAVACAAYMGFTPGVPDVWANALLGYCLLQLLLFLRELRWVSKQPFAISYWTTTLGITALSTASMIMYQRMSGQGVGALAPYLFWLANVVVGSTIAGTAGTMALQARNRWRPATSQP